MSDDGKTHPAIRGMKNMIGVSSGTCPGCALCMESDGYTDAAKHADAYRTQDLPSNCPDFSWRPCDICGTKLGGDRSVWHWIDADDPDRTIHHDRSMCNDCVFFLANGDEPESWSV